MSIFEDTTSNLINTSKATSRPMVTNGVYVGKVVRIDTDGRPYVLIPKVNPNAIFGPCKSFSYVTTVGSLVSVSFLDNRLDEAVILASDHSTELTGYLEGVSSSVQIQINEKVSIVQPIRSVTTSSDTPTISDVAKLIVINTSSGAVSITINNSLWLAAGQSIDFAWVGAATSVTFIASGLGSGGLYGTPGLKLRTRYSAATLKCLATHQYLLVGDLSA